MCAWACRRRLLLAAGCAVAVAVVGADAELLWAFALQICRPSKLGLGPYYCGHQWIAENNKKARSCSQDLVGAVPRSRRVAASMPTHQVSHNRCFLEAWRLHDRCRVCLLAERKAPLQPRFGSSPPSTTSTRPTSCQPATHRADFLNTTGKFLLPLMRRRLHDRFSDSRFAAPIRCLRIPTAWASEHQESNSDGSRGREGGYLCPLLVPHLW